jgi:hypothetical protein
MATIDVHRLLDAKLPAGKTCESVSMVEVYTAVINGEPVACQCEPGERADLIADVILSQATEPSPDNAQQEGSEIHEPADDAEPHTHGKHKKHK